MPPPQAQIGPKLGIRQDSVSVPGPDARPETQITADTASAFTSSAYIRSQPLGCLSTLVCMYSLEEELRAMRAAGALDDASASGMIAVEQRTVFSLYEELRAALYAAVALVVTGVGILVKEHLDRIGPLTLMAALAVAGATCYVPAIRAQSRTTPRSAVAEYLLLLGALLISADVGYAESQFHWFGANWSRQLLILAALHGFTAYVFDSRLILSVALTSLAGWLGVAPLPGSIATWHFGTGALGLRALLCAAVILLWRAIDRRLNAARFREVFEHFAANVAFWGALGWCTDAHDRLIGVLALFALATFAIRSALRSGIELFAVYGVGYPALGLSIVVGQILELPSLSGAIAILVIVLAATVVLRQFHERLKEAQP